MALDNDVKQAYEMYRKADESGSIGSEAQYNLMNATFHMLRATATRMVLTPEISDDVKQAYEMYRKADESGSIGSKAQYNLMDACYHLAKAIQERKE